MEKRSHHREELVGMLPADKRVCSDVEYKSNSSKAIDQAVVGSKNSQVEHQYLDMESSSSLSEMGREEESSQSEMLDMDLTGRYSNPEDDVGAAPPCSDSLKSSATSASRAYQDVGQHYDRTSFFGPKKGQLNQICSSLKIESSFDSQLASLAELCDVLSLCTEDLINFSSLDLLVPTLIILAKHENPEIILLSIRALTHICNITRLSSSFISRHDIVPALCAQLTMIEYIDVAEQCLQALEKISYHHPIVCLQSGVIMAALMYIDFFPAAIQKVALATVANICRKLPSDSFSIIRGGVPILCNLLHHDDQKIVESSITCLINIIRCFSCSDHLLDELLKHDFLQQATFVLSINSHVSLRRQVFTDLMEILVTVVSISPAAMETLLDMNIISTLRDILASCKFSCGMVYSLAGDAYSDQILSVMDLLNELLPEMESETVKPEVLSCKENRLKDKAGIILRQFESEILPLLIHVVGSGANLSLSYSCLCIMNKLVHHSTSHMIKEIFVGNKISGFLTGVISLKDDHVVIPALQIIDNLMQKFPDVCAKLFVKEGIVAAINALLHNDSSSNDKNVSLESTVSRENTGSSQKRLTKGNNKCLCLRHSVVSPTGSEEVVTCKVKKEMVGNLAKHIKDTHFPEEMQISASGLTERLQKLKALCGTLIQGSDTKYSMATDAPDLCGTVRNILSELKGGEPLSTFEFIESGIIRSLACYLGCGKNLNHQKSDQFKRFLSFAGFSLASTAGQWKDMPLAILVEKLLNVISASENLPVIHTDLPKWRNSYVNIPTGYYTSHACLRVRFVKDEGDKSFCGYSSRILTIELFTSFDVIEDYLCSSFRKNDLRSETVVTALQESSTTENVSSSSSDLLDFQGHAGKQPSIPQDEGCAESRSTSIDLQQACKIGSSSGHASTCTKDASRNQQSGSTKQCMPLKLDFYLKRKRLNRSLTVCQAILLHLISEHGLHIGSRLWNEVFQISFKRAFQTGEKSADMEGNLKREIGIPSTKFHSLFSTEFPLEVGITDAMHDVLALLKVMESLNRFSCDLMLYERHKSFSEGKISGFVDFKGIAPVIPQNEFISSKLTEKLEQQLQDALAVDTSCLPPWCSCLVTGCPFLFSFEARRKYFQICVSGLSRSTERTSGQQMSTIDDVNVLNRSLPRKKFCVQRSSIMASAMQMMNMHASDKAVLDVEYSGEVGTGLGPTMEFYILVSHEFQKANLGMWRETDWKSRSAGDAESFKVGSMISSPFGLFPQPWSLNTSNSVDFCEVEKKFVLLGQVIAKGLQDGRMLDLSFSKPFFKLILGEDLDIYDIRSFDPDLGKAMEEFHAIVDRKKFMESKESNLEKISHLCFQGSRVEDLCLDFTLPGYPEYILKEGEDYQVDIDNLEEYVLLVVDATVRSGISRQVEAFKSGFNQVFPLEHLHIFTEDELDRLLCGERDAWVFDSFVDHVKFDHGYTSSSLPVINLLEIIRKFGHDERSAFLRFVTGAPRLPPGGLAALNPKLTIVRKNSGGNVDLNLPSVMTCANYLKLPPYTTKERTRERLLYAITEGQGSFHLS